MGVRIPSGAQYKSPALSELRGFFLPCGIPAGEAAEFDTRTPHWFGRVGPGDVEFLTLFGRQGERMHVRAAPPSRLGE